MLFRVGSLVKVESYSGNDPTLQNMVGKWLHVSSDEGGENVKLFLPDEITIVEFNRNDLYAIYLQK